MKAYSLKINDDDLAKITAFSDANGLSVSWAIRRAVKDFIVNYVNTNTMPEAEKSVDRN